MFRISPRLNLLVPRRARPFWRTQTEDSPLHQQHLHLNVAPSDAGSTCQQIIYPEWLLGCAGCKIQTTGQGTHARVYVGMESDTGADFNPKNVWCVHIDKDANISTPPQTLVASPAAMRNARREVGTLEVMLHTTPELPARRPITGMLVPVNARLVPTVAAKSKMVRRILRDNLRRCRECDGGCGVLRCSSSTDHAV
jgi:hypothetical protein